MSLFLAIGIAVAVFVGINIGGSSSGVAFGPAVGSRVLSARKAAAFMAVFALLGGLLVGPHVVETLGTKLVPPAHFTLPAAIAVLLFTGAGILVGNILRVSVSTSETAVGAVIGMGAALNVLEWGTVGVILVWWIVSGILVFWIAAVTGRYLYDRIAQALAPVRDSRWIAALVIAMGGYMAFSAGASNAANAVAPLVGSGMNMFSGVLLAGLAIGAGSFLLGPRTMHTVGHEITDLPVTATLIVEVIAATTITLLSRAGIPASLAITATLCVIGLGWGRATRNTPLVEGIARSDRTSEENGSPDLYNIHTVRKVLATWMFTPFLAAFLAFLTFKLATVFHILPA